MNKREKEVIQLQLQAEEDVLHELEKQYKSALKDINDKVKLFDYDINMLNDAVNQVGIDDAARERLLSQQRSKAYQKQYQEAMKKQIEGILDKLQSDEYSTLQDYLHKCYNDSYLGTMYDLHGQGIPLIMPIDQAAAVKAIMTDSKISEGLYNSLGVDVKGLKKDIRQEITRGIASGLSYADIARNISNTSKAPLSRAKDIARTEGHRVQEQSTLDAQFKAKSKGADVVKQWDATLDGATRPVHRQLDGQIREVEEYFEAGGKKAKYPGGFGDPAQDCNCRCKSLTRARWDLDEDELETLKKRAEYFGLDKTKDFEDFKKKYLKAEKEVVKEEADTKTQIADINKKATDALLEAYDDRRKHFGMTTLSADEIRKSMKEGKALGGSWVDYTGVSVQTANAFNDTITALSHEYYTGFTKIEVGNPKAFFGVTNFAATKHLDTVGQKTLVLNPFKTKDYDKLVERVQEISKSGHAVKIADADAGKYIATHEFAHSLIDMKSPLKNYVGIDEKQMKKIRKEIDNVFVEYSDEVAKIEREIEVLKKNPAFTDFSIGLDEQWQAFIDLQEAQDKLKKVKISNYSLQNADEFLAEAFTQSKIGIDQSPYSDKLMQVVDKHFKKETLANTVKKEYNSGAISGAYNDKNDPRGKKRDAHAKLYYEELRKSSKDDFVSAVSQNASIESEAVGKAYKHVFEDKHELTKGYDYFDPDYDMAESFRRLRTNDNIQEHDRVLILHEALEFDIMKANPGMSYDEAHELAEKTYNYTKALDEWQEKGGK